MLGPLLFLQLAVAQPKPLPTYASRDLAAFIAAAAARNQPPAALRRYRAHVESELSLILRDTLGRENVVQVEQLALQSQWRRGVDYTLRVVGYRSESVGVPYSALSFVRGWTVPSLYGDRLVLGVELARDAKESEAQKRASIGSDTARAAKAGRGSGMLAVHPLARDRERYYRFAGGDTIARVHSASRVIPIVRVRVTPTFDSMPRDTTLTVFDGEIDFDATRQQIVRMRGRFVIRGAPQHGFRHKLATLPGVVAVAFVEFVNAEVDGRYWLPQFQRTEFQATVAPLGNQRSVFRLVSHFSDVLICDSRADSEHVVQTPGTTLEASREASKDERSTLTFASEDSVSRFHAWQQPLGVATAAVSASDFHEYMPDAWRPDGPARLDFAPTRLDQVFRFDRVEGAYTGAALALRFRDSAPGLTASIDGGWAWSEQTARGSASIKFARGVTTLAGRLERSLVSTNDFAPPVDEGTIGFAGLFGADDQDYVDRREATADLTRVLGTVSTAVVSIDGGVGEDRHETSRVGHGAFGVGTFRANRAAVDGRYARAAARLELHPNVTGLFLEPGAGLVASYEIARGQLNWQRAQLTLSLRRSVRDLVLAARVQGGAVFGSNLPPQQLFEIGGEGALPGYAYKEFAGDGAAVGGLLLSYPLPLLRRPWHLVRSLVLPGAGPGLAIGIQSGWTGASSDRVLAAIRALNPLTPRSCIDNPVSTCPAPLSLPTQGVRATIDGRLTLFSGLLGFGVARAVDRAGRWRFVFRFGPEY